MYINKDNEIEKIREESFLLSKPNFILREEIIGILKKTLCDNQRKYTLFSILKYNITLSPENIRDYLFYSQNDSENYLTIIKNIDTIFFEKIRNHTYIEEPQYVKFRFSNNNNSILNAKRSMNSISSAYANLSL
jgi:hypothetical protein